MAIDLRRQRRNRLMLLLIASLSLLPFLLAWLYFKHPQWITQRSNYGTLIIPPRPLSYAELLPPDEAADGPLEGIKGRWILLQVSADGTCGTACGASLLNTRQIRLLLNKDISRVRRLLLKPAASPPLSGRFFTQDDDLLQGGLSNSLLATLTDAVGHRPEDGAVILIDPFANVMMWYAPGFDPYGVLKDLKHLLRNSQIG